MNLQIVLFITLLIQLSFAFLTDTFRRKAGCYSWAIYKNPHFTLNSLFSTTDCQPFIGNWNSGVEVPPTCIEYSTASGDKFMTCRPDNADIVYLVFKGSDELDWLDASYGNLNADPYPLQKLRGGTFFGGANAVHTGIARSWVVSRQQVLTALQEACPISTQCQYIFTGHSRGGSMVNMAMFNFVLERPSKAGLYNFSHVYENPLHFLRVITFGEPHAVDFQAIAASPEYLRIAAVQNTVKERWIDCDTMAVTCDPATWIGAGFDYDGFGKMIKIQNGASAGHSMSDNYLYSFFAKKEVDRLRLQCIRDSDNLGGETTIFDNCVFRFTGCTYNCANQGGEAACTGFWTSTLSYSCPAPALPAPEPEQPESGPEPTITPPPPIPQATPKPSVFSSFSPPESVNIGTKIYVSTAALVVMICILL